MSLVSEGLAQPYPLRPVEIDSQQDDIADMRQVSAVDFAEQIPEVTVERVCSSTQDPAVILAARQLVASRYRARRYITPQEINEQGVIANDPAHEHSTYYAEFDQSSDGSVAVVATVRKTHWNAERGDQSFPLWKDKDKLDSDAVAEIENIGLENCVEITALVKNGRLDRDGGSPFRLYKTIFQDSLKLPPAELSDDEKTDEQPGNEEVYLMAAAPMLFEVFKTNFNGYIKRIGPDLDYPGQPVVPAMIQPHAGIVDALNRMSADEIHNEQLKGVINFLIDGLDESNIHEDVREALEHARTAGVVPQAKPEISDIATDVESSKTDEDLEISVDAKGVWDRVKMHLARRKPEYAGGAFLVGYSIARTYGVAEGISPETDVDWRVFLGVEIATTPTYLWGLGDMVRSQVNPENYSRARKIGAVSLWGGSLVAPYAYVLGEGGEATPGSALAGVGAFFAISAVTSARRMIASRKARRQAEQSPELQAEE